MKTKRLSRSPPQRQEADDRLPPGAYVRDVPYSLQTHVPIQGRKPRHFFGIVQGARHVLKQSWLSGVNITCLVFGLWLKPWSSKSNVLHTHVNHIHVNTML